LTDESSILLSEELSLVPPVAAEPTAVAARDEEESKMSREDEPGLDASLSPMELERSTLGMEEGRSELENKNSGNTEKALEAVAKASELEVAAKKHLAKKASAKKPARKKEAQLAKPTAEKERVLGMGLPAGCQCNPSEMLLPGQKTPLKGERRCPVELLSQEQVDAEFQPADPANDPLQHLSEAARQEVIARAQKRAAGYEKLGKTMEQECKQQ